MRLPPWLHPLLLLARHLVAAWQWARAPVVRRGPGTSRAAREVAWDVPLPQPTRTTCGSAVLVVMDLLEGGTPLGPDAADDFGRRAVATMRRTNTWRDRRGRLQLPWPPSLGTRPAALIRELGGGWSNRVVDPRHPERAWRMVQDAGRPVPVYVGEGSWMQHVVLVTDIDEEQMTVYEPARGVLVTRTRRDFETAQLDLGGWDQPWLVVVPTRPRRSRSASRR